MPGPEAKQSSDIATARHSVLAVLAVRADYSAHFNHTSHMGVSALKGEVGAEFIFLPALGADGTAQMKHGQPATTTAVNPHRATRSAVDEALRQLKDEGLITEGSSPITRGAFTITAAGREALAALDAGQPLAPPRPAVRSRFG